MRFFLPFWLLIAFQAMNTDAFTIIPTEMTTIPTTVLTTPLNPIQPQVKYICYLPKTFYDKEFYKIFILVLNAKQPTEISIYVNNKLQKRENVTTGVPTVLMTNFTISRKNEVRVIGKGDVNFEKKVIVFEYRSIYKPGPALFVQTSQSIYHPKDKVRLRCFALNTNFHILKAGIDIKIYGPRGNLIHAWYNQRSRTGVISRNFKLSNRPCLFGIWSIELFQKKTNLKASYMFIVKKKIFEHAKVEISGDIYAYRMGLNVLQFIQQSMHIVIEARFHNGEPIKGKLILRISPAMYPYKVFTKVFPFHGKYNYKFKLKDFLKPSQTRRYIILTIKAKVIETSTNFDVSSRIHYIYIKDYPLSINKPNKWVQQKLGLCNQFIVYVKPITGDFLNLQDIQGKVNVTFFGLNTTVTNTYCIPLDGLIRVDIPNIYIRWIIILYTGFYQKYQYKITKKVNVWQYSPHFNPIKASLINKDYYAGDEVHIRLTCTSFILKIYYMVVRRHDIVSVGTISKFGNNLVVNIKTNKDWLPGIKIFLNAVTITNQVAIDMVAVQLKIRFQYEIEGRFLPSANYAGTFTKLKIKSARRSTAFYLVVDDRLDELRKYNYISKYLIMRKLFHTWMPLHTPIFFNLKSLLQWSGMDLASNALIARGSYKQPTSYMPTLPVRKSEEQPKFCLNSRSVWRWRKKHFRKNTYVYDNLRVPENIATWKTNVFSVHHTKGISILEKPFEFQSYQKMCLTFDLPRCIFVRERLRIKVIVFNCFPFARKATVIFLNKRLLCRRKRSEKVLVPAKSYRIVYFWVCPRSVGKKTIRVKLFINKKMIDQFRRSFLVKFIGHTVYFTNEKRINLRSKKKHVMKIRKPGRYKVWISTDVKICVSGDIMAIVLRNLGKLVRLPTNCGEQIASIFAWNVYMYAYLQSRKALSRIQRTRLESLIKSDYQSQLCYQLYDGSYTIFKYQGRGNVWLTAFVLENFQQVIDNKINVQIDEKKMRSSLRWLLERQNADGSFQETGRIFHPQLQGQGKSSIPLTAYVVASLISLKNIKHPHMKKIIKKSEKYLSAQNLKKLDVYTLCIMLYAYDKLENKNYFRKIEKILLRKAKKGRKIMYWKGKYDVEQTGYVLLAYSRKKHLLNGRKILAWLLSKRNDLGGFSNTQNTAVCIKAFSKFGRYLGRIKNGKIQVYTNRRQRRTFVYKNKKNLLRLYISKLHRTTKRVFIRSKGKGRGMATIKLSWKYNLRSERNNIFGLNVKVKAKLNPHLILTICYKLKKTSDPGMLTSEIQLPTGYVKRNVVCGARICDKFSNCSRCVIQSEDTDEGLALYLGKLTTVEFTCVIVEAVKQQKVINRKNKLFVTTTSYYTGKKCIRSYKLPR